MTSPAARTEIVTPATQAEFDAVRALCWEYRDFLIGLSDFDAEIVRAFYPTETYRSVLDRIEIDHVPPAGITRLAYLDGAPVGCGMVQTLPDGSAEIKRVFVRSGARGSGLGRALCERLIADCRDMGFARIRLDTSRSLDTAQRLYEALGFVPRGPYQPVPEIAKPLILFYELALEPGHDR